jgi:hypothetical protein
MRNHISYTALAIALMGGTSLAHAQTIETVITQQPVPMVIAQQPVITPAPGIVVAQPAETAPVQTVETVRTVESTTTPRPRIASRHVVRSRTGDRVTTTRTIVREAVVSPPTVVAAPAATPAVAAIAQPTYTEVVQPPVVSASTYPAPLYDVVPGTALAPPPVVTQPVIGAAVVSPLPAYRYVYEPDRILVIDSNTGIAVQAIPR